MMIANNMKSGLNLSFLVTLALTAAAAEQASAVLYLYEPFDYFAGESLGGSGGEPIGQIGSYTQDFGSGDSYNWYARGTGGPSTHDPALDATISSGSLSYPGLAASQGNSVSYGSALPNPANDAFNKSLYGDTVALPVEVTSGSLYASFIVRIKSEVENGAATADRHSPAMFTSADSVPGIGIPTVQSGSAATVGSFWMRRDPVDVTNTRSNFGVGKSSSDGSGAGQNVNGNNAGYQNSDPTLPARVESNQFGDLDGQTEPLIGDPNTWQTYFVVLKYEFDFLNTSADDYDAPGSTPGDHSQLDTVSLWMNPNSATLGVANGEILASANPSANAGSYYAATDSYGSGTLDIASIKSFALLGHRQTTNETFALDIDELRIGTTWADVTPAASAGQPGDHNGDGEVDAADYVAWRKTDGGNQDGYDAFVENFGEPAPGGSAPVPEPTALVLLAFSASAAVFRHRRS